MKTYVLDASALICFVSAEPGHKRVSEILKEAAAQRCSVRMSLINWGEVVYNLWTARGEEVARKTVAGIDGLNVQLEPVARDDALASAQIKAVHHLAYADSFAAALAVRTGGTLVTTDPHFRRLGKRLPILWLR